MSAFRLRLLLALVAGGLNGLFSLVVLLIAPLGLATVLTLTLLISFSTIACSLGSHAVLRWLQSGPGLQAARPRAGIQLPPGQGRV